MAIADDIALLINSTENTGVESRHGHEPTDQHITAAPAS